MKRIWLLLALTCSLAGAADRTAQQIQSADRYTFTAYPLYGALVTPNDSADLAQPGFIRANGDGNVVVICYGSTSSITLALVVGEIVPCLVKRVLSTGTTATPLHVFY
jgi:hypothetical protein